MRVRVVATLADIDRDAWNALDHRPSPFLEYGFLRALELSASVGSTSGWAPYYFLAETERDGFPWLVGAVAGFVKSHSYGEYIFDWGWASACERAGIQYYPKLVVAAPMTPATGRRLLVHPEVAPGDIVPLLAGAVRDVAAELGCSSVHWLFVTEGEHRQLAELGFLPRASFQFHWHNRGYASFDDFLARMTSRRRKQVRKERQRARSQVDEFCFVPGCDLAAAQLDLLDRFYRETTHQYGGIDYLRPGFFHYLGEFLPDRVVVAEARRGRTPVASGLYLETEEGLYGRYWGCAERIEFLHFETAYYAGIERCIDRQIRLFEAGAQGEHKLLRGFVPSPTYSNHWLADARLAAAVGQFLADERRQVARRMEQLAAYLPYNDRRPKVDR